MFFIVVGFLHSVLPGEKQNQLSDKVGQTSWYVTGGLKEKTSPSKPEVVAVLVEDNTYWYSGHKIELVLQQINDIRCLFA